ncbi:MAG: hypothetical protein WED08_00810 [Patescibacteria group bacterium]
MGIIESFFGRPPARPSAGILKPFDKSKIENDWARIDQLIQDGRPSALKEAVIAADKLLDYALMQVSSGEAMGERLKNADRSFSREVYQGLWDAHKMRNALVHDPNFDLSGLVAREVLEKFQRGFQYLGVRI